MYICLFPQKKKSYIIIYVYARVLKLIKQQRL